MRVIAALSLLLSCQAFACPDLSGRYVCEEDGKPVNIVLIQSIKNGVTVYNMNGFEMPADDLARGLPDNESFRNSTIQSRCESEGMLTSYIVGDYYDRGIPSGVLSVKWDLSVEHGDLIRTYNGQLTNSNGNVYNFDETTVCTGVAP